jgi:uncharacterized protein
MQFTWNEKKRASNRKAHKLDFEKAASVFEGHTFTFEDDRFDYAEERFVTLGFLEGVAVSLVHTESENEIHCISFRYATKREESILLESLG